MTYFQIAYHLKSFCWFCKIHHVFHDIFPGFFYFFRDGLNQEITALHLLNRSWTGKTHIDTIIFKIQYCNTSALVDRKAILKSLLSKYSNYNFPLCCACLAKITKLINKKSKLYLLQLIIFCHKNVANATKNIIRKCTVMYCDFLKWLLRQFWCKLILVFQWQW